MPVFIGLQDFVENPPIVKIDLESAKRAGVKLFLKREDQIHKRLSGNKWRKLKYNLFDAHKENKETLLSFGGAFSNHIAALAEAGNLFNFKTIGIIRGEEYVPLNPTLERVKNLGMELIFVNRSDYRNKSELIKKLLVDLDQTYMIPEGGTNTLALKGCAEIISQCTEASNMDFWCIACGTGGTAAGMIAALEEHQTLIGFSVLKGNFMEQNIHALLESEHTSQQKWMINHDYHFGGYARFTSELIDFINSFKKKYNISLDPIYTGKLLYGVFDLIEKGYFAKGSNIMIVHTGGQQGIQGFNDRFDNVILT